MTEIRAILRAEAEAPVLSVANLEVSLLHSRLPVIEQVSFSLAPGEILGLVGETGSGKTTLGLGLLGHHRPGLAITGGEVLIAGHDLLKVPPSQIPPLRRKLICYVPQDPGTALNPALRIQTQLRECFDRPNEADSAHLLALLAEVRLPATAGFLRAYPHQLSGGQQQRVALAMAYANRPRVIVLDEPTTGLDVTTQSHVLQTVRQLCLGHGIAAVYVSHDLAVVASLAHRVAVMYAGRIVELGPTWQVLYRPAHPYTRALTKAVPDVRRRNRVEGIPGQAPEPERRPPGCAFAPRCPRVVPACRTAAPEPLLLTEEHMTRCLRPDDSPPAQPEISLPAEKTPGGDQPILRVERLGAYYGRAEILQGVSFAIPEHSCAALVGESGSGKTTLARAVGGLHRDMSGQIEFRGTLLASGARQRSAELRRRIQYIFQNPYASLNPRRSIGRSIAFALWEFESLSAWETRQRVGQALQDAALPAEMADRLPRELSGGQRQRAAIARALAVRPELLICDEITSSLDVSVQAVIIALLARLQREHGLSMLFITHNLALVRSIAQTVIVLQDGRIVEAGAVDDILGQPKAPETCRLLEDAPHFAVTEAD